MRTITGIPASSGVVIGKALVYDKNSHYLTGLEIRNSSPEQSIVLFRNGITRTVEKLEELVQKTECEIGTDEAGIFDAQILMLEDEDFQEAVVKLLKAEIPLDEAIWRVIDQYAKQFQEMDNEYFRERAADIKDVGNQLIKVLSGETVSFLAGLENRVIIVSQELTPSDTAEMNKDKVIGFATELGGKNAHVSIIARALGVPAVVGTSTLVDFVKNGDTIVVDGFEGRVIINPDQTTLDYYEAKRGEYEQKTRGVMKFRAVKAVTKDNFSIQIQANIGSLKEVDYALKNGAEGIGLLRTEFLYLDRQSLPTENELFAIFKEILTKMENKPVVLRIIDIGGDKDVPYLDLPDETNPFLGLRGSRLYSDPGLRNVIVTQVRAALRASIFGDLKLMFPMVTDLQEVQKLTKMVDITKKSILNAGKDVTDSVEIGIMIEVPSAAICADILAPYVDFFSIGTNDLTQYILASDRTNEAVSDIYDHYHPAVIRLLDKTVKAAHSYGKWVGICGELAGEPLATPLLVGLGVDELSMNPPAIPHIKSRVSAITRSECQKLARRILTLATPEDVKLALKSYDSD